jgi:hypothetical protein
VSAPIVIDVVLEDDEHHREAEAGHAERMVFTPGVPVRLVVSGYVT